MEQGNGDCKIIKIRKKVILFYNPRSGSGVFKSNLDTIVDRYQQAGYIICPVRASEGLTVKEYLASLDKETYQKEYYQIIAAGGDGTINICVNAMIEEGIDLPLAVFPAGTANDFAYYFDIPYDIEKMIDIALSNKFSYADVGVVNDKYFINVAAMGPVADISQNTDTALKNSIGMLAYYMQAIAELPKLKPVKVKMETRNEVYEEDMYFMVVLNGKSAGGMRKLGSESEINDGLLDVYLFRDMKVLDLVPLIVKIMQGNHTQSDKVLSFKTDYLKLTSEDHISTDIDGEHGEELPLVFGIVPSRLRIMDLMGNDLSE